MGKIDTITKDYMSENAVFADACNYYIYDGKRVIKPENLRELDSTVISAPYGANGEVLPIQKFRDEFKGWTVKTDGSNVYLLLGIENQSNIHYAMPVRNMVYDALQYADQVDRTAKKHKGDRKAGLKREEKITADEYLSGFFRSDRLIPVITLVIYFGSEPWDGPETLHEMFHIQDKEILSLVPDYKLNLIVPARMTKEEIDKLDTDLREVLLFIKYSKDKDHLTKIVKEDERFHHLEQKTIRVINEVTHSQLNIEEKDGEGNMCQAIDELRRDAYEEGRQSMSNAIDEIRRDAYEEGRQSMGNAIDEIRRDAYEEGRQSISNEIDELRRDAYEEGRQSMGNAIVEIRRDAYEEGRQSISNEIDELRRDAYEEGILEIAKKLIIKNISDDFIIEVTDVSKEVLIRMKESLLCNV